jgi:hypothetical protein
MGGRVGCCSGIDEPDGIDSMLGLNMGAAEGA